MLHPHVPKPRPGSYYVELDAEGYWHILRLDGDAIVWESAHATKGEADAQIEHIEVCRQLHAKQARAAASDQNNGPRVPFLTRLKEQLLPSGSRHPQHVPNPNMKGTHGATAHIP